MTDNIYKNLSEERKKLQAAGLVPEWYSTGAFQVFKGKYDYDTNGRSVRGQFERISKAAAKHIKGTKFEAEAESKFFELMWNGWMSLSSPIMANMGTNRGLPVSCSGAVVGDSIHDFYANRLETAILTKNGFGTSAYLGNIRPRGSAISVGGKASGVVPVFKGHVQDMRDVAQGTSRRGAWAGYLEIDHGDFDELADFIYNEPDDCNIGWLITDAFIAKLDAGDEESVRRFQKALKMKMVVGRGYFLFIDKVNRARPDTYKDHGLTVKNSNLCLTGDTVVDVKIGEQFLRIPLDVLVSTATAGVNIEVLSENVETKERAYKRVKAAAMTARNAKLVKITDTETGKSIRCTPDHQIFTLNRGYVMAKDLTPEDKLQLK